MGLPTTEKMKVANNMLAKIESKVFFIVCDFKRLLDLVNVLFNA